MEVSGSVWVQIIASLGVLTPLVLGILGFIERRSKAAKAAEDNDGSPGVTIGEAIDPHAASVSELLRERIAHLERRVQWVAEERNYYYRTCADAGLDVPAPRVEVTS